MYQPNDEPRDLATGFLEDLRTQWVPDAIGASDVLSAMRHRDSEAVVRDSWAVWRDVATKDGLRSFPDVDVATRGLLHWHTEIAGRSWQQSLHPSVFGYRDATTVYSRDWLRFQDRVRELADEHEVVIRADVKAFFASVRLDELARGPWMTPELHDLLELVNRLTGWVLLPGHRWSRRIANVLLSVVDEDLPHAFCRWQDDYVVFCDSATLAKAAVEDLETLLARIGLELQPAKTEFEEAEAVSAKIEHRPTDPADHDLVEMFMTAVSQRNAQGAKYALARLAEGTEKLIVPSLANAIAQMPVLAPRAAAYLDAALPDSDTARLIRDLLAEEDDWIFGRILPVVVRSKELSGELGRQLLNKLAEHRDPAIRDLVARLALQQGSSLGACSARVHLWASATDDPWADPPLLETRL